MSDNPPAPKKARMSDKCVYELGPILFLATRDDINRVRDDFYKGKVDDYEFAVECGCTLYWEPDDILLRSDVEEEVRMFTRMFDTGANPVGDALEQIADRCYDEETDDEETETD